MSYLDPPRLHFAGTFAATISTVNNDPAHFDNAAFKPEYQERLRSKPNPFTWTSEERLDMRARTEDARTVRVGTARAATRAIPRGEGGMYGLVQAS